VIAIVVIVLLIAVPTYLGVVEKAHSTAAQVNLRAAIPDVEAYYQLTGNTYVGLDLQWLRGYDPGVDVNDPGLTPEKQTATSYCVSATVSGKTWYKAGPGAPITNVAC
jgi:Tfp pilus assembly protein PilE